MPTESTQQGSQTNRSTASVGSSSKKRMKLYRSRSNTDSDALFQRLRQLELGAAANSNPVGGGDGETFALSDKRRLYKLFSLIEKEFENLQSENLTLHAKIEALSDRLSEVGTLPPEKATEIIELISTDAATPKSFAGKKASHVGQKLKTAFRVQPGRNLVSSFKAGVTGGYGGGGSSCVRLVKNYEGHRDGIWHVDVSKAPKLFLGSASADQTARIWCIDTGSCLVNYTGHVGSVNCISFHPVILANQNELLVVTASGDQSAHVWKANVSSTMSTLAGSKTSGASQVPPTHSSEDELETLSEKEEPTAEIDSEHTTVVRAPLVKLTGHTSVVIAADWLLGGNQIITASWDRTALIYDAERGEIINTLTGHDHELTHCSTHCNQRLVVTSSRDTTFRLWDFRESIHSVAVFQGHTESVTSAMFSSSDKLVSGSDDRTLKIWDLRNMRSALTTIRTDSSVNRLSMSQTYGVIAIPHDNRNVRLYDLNGQRIARLPRSNRRGHKRLVACAAWSDDNQFANLFTCGFDKCLFGWKVLLGGNKE